MKSKITEKIFDLIYTDSLTETYNRNAYDDRLKKLRKQRVVLNNVTVAVVCVENIKELKKCEREIQLILDDIAKNFSRAVEFKMNKNKSCGCGSGNCSK